MGRVVPALAPLEPTAQELVHSDASVCLQSTIVNIVATDYDARVVAPIQQAFDGQNAKENALIAQCQATLAKLTE